MILIIFQINPTRTSVFSGDFVHLSLIVLLFFSPSGLSVELYGAINFSPPQGQNSNNRLWNLFFTFFFFFRDKSDYCRSFFSPMMPWAVVCCSTLLPR